jgi:uncharacterized protein
MSYVSTSDSDIFGRAAEWELLHRFVVDPLPGSRLAVVRGRRRQGKTMLLQELAAVAGSFYWEAAEQSEHQNLESFSAAWTSHLGDTAGPIRFRSWDEALATVLRSTEAARGVLIDEVGYLIATSPSFPSLLQGYFGPQAERLGAARVVLCGSIYAQMAKLLDIGAPLRGRHSLIIDVQPFGFREAAEFWGLSGNLDAAFQLDALVGGTPAYLRYAGWNRPVRGNVAKWAQQYLLSPTSPLYQEGQLLVAQDPMLVDKALYWSVLGAVADGHARRSAIAEAVGRPAAALSQALTILSAGKWIDMVPDPLHDRSTTVQLIEPIVRTYRTLIAPNGRRLDRGQAQAVWEDSQHRIARLINAPHLETVANEWLIRYATPRTAGGSIRLAAPAVLRRGGSTNQIDVVAVSPDRNDVDRICAIGEVKSERQAMGLAELDRLDELAAALGSKAAPVVKRLLVARSGFTAELTRTARGRSDVELIDLDRLYSGD